MGQAEILNLINKTKMHLTTKQIFEGLENSSRSVVEIALKKLRDRNEIGWEKKRYFMYFKKVERRLNR